MNDNLDYKDSEEIWLGKIPVHWTEGHLKYLLDRNDGGVWGQEAADEGTLVLRSTEITIDGKLQIENPAIRSLTFDEIQKSLLKTGDLLITKSSGSEIHIGKTALITTEVENLGACYSNFMQRIRPKYELNSRFLHYFLNSYIAREQYNYQSTTTTGLANLNSEIIGLLVIPFIPLPEQRAISDFLDRKIAQIDRLIEKKQRQVELLQEQRAAIINQAVTKGLNPDAPMKDSGIEWLGEIPQHWVVKQLKYIGKAFIGLTYKPDDIVDEGKGNLVLRASNVNDGKIILNDNVYVNTKIPQHLITRAGDILICSRSGSNALIGKNALIDNISAGYSFGVFMTLFRSEINDFLSYVFKSRLFKFQSGLFITSTINQLTLSSLYSFRIPIPPNNEQVAIIQYLDNQISKIDELINKIIRVVEKLKEYRMALISEAVTGKIDVRSS